MLSSSRGFNEVLTETNLFCSVLVITGRRDADTQKRRGTAEARRLGSRRVLQV